MTSYRQTAYNGFETPSGAVGEAPDGPGAFQHVMDQVDGRIGVGGAERCADAAAINAIPANRLFSNKLAYSLADDTMFRFTASSVWVPWEKGFTQFTPPILNITKGDGTIGGYYWIASGVYHVKTLLLFGSATTITAGPAFGCPNSQLMRVGAGQTGITTIRDDSAAMQYGGTLKPGGGTANVSAQWMLPISGQGTNGLTPTAPFAFTVNDSIACEWSYIPV